MRIGIVTSSYPVSSTDSVTAGVFVRDLAYEMANRGHQVHVVTPRKYGKPDSSDLVPVYYFPWLGGEKDLASASMQSPVTLFRYTTLIVSGSCAVSQFSRRHRLDVLLAMWAIPSGLFSWLAWKRWGIPYAVWALGSDIWVRKRYPFGDRIVRTVLRDAKFRFADGRKLAHEVGQLGHASCEFVPSIRRLPALDRSKTASLPSDIPNFLFIGRYEYNKGPDILVEAMRMLLDGGHEAHLHLFGVGSLQPYLHERVKGYEAHIHLGGYADPELVVAYMSACDWLIIPSRIESIPLIFVDAIQMRLPLIATDVGDLGDFVRSLNVGQVVPPAEPSALAVAMVQALSRSRVDFEQAWESASKVFSLERSTDRCLESLAAALRAAP